jgi:hypothetical protein
LLQRQEHEENKSVDESARFAARAVAFADYLRLKQTALVK